MSERGPGTMGELYPIRYRSPRGSVLTIHAGRLHTAVADWDYSRIYPACGAVSWYAPEDVIVAPEGAAVSCKRCSEIVRRRVSRGDHLAWYIRRFGTSEGWTYPGDAPSPAEPSVSGSSGTDEETR